MLKCELLKPEVLMYIFSLAFQVAGAVLLIIKYLGKTKERIIDEYFPGSNCIERDDNNIAKLERDKVCQCARKIYDNRASFAYIAIGYILSIFGVASGECKICILNMVIVCTIILIILEKVVSIIISVAFYKNDIEIEYDKIKDRADTIVTEKEMDDMFKEVFGSSK